MVNHWQLIYRNKFPTLMALYGVEEEWSHGSLLPPMGAVHVTGYFATCSGQLNGCLVRDLYDVLCIGRQPVKSGHVTVFVWLPNWSPCIMSSSYVFMDVKWLPVLVIEMNWLLCIFFLCLLGWSPGWSLCLCITWGDLVHTTQVSHFLLASEAVLFQISKSLSVLCSWQVHCLGWVIWWSDRNKQGLLTESVNKCILCVLK